MLTPIFLTSALLVLSTGASVGSIFTTPASTTEPAVPESRGGLLYLNMDGLTLQAHPCGTGENSNAALDCTSAIDVDTPVEAITDQTLRSDLQGALETALAPYNIRIVTERPDPYVPYTMIVPTAIDDTVSESTTCVLDGFGSCAAAKRNGLTLLVNSTTMCTDPNPITQVLYAAGIQGGLEGVTSAADPMNSPPDFMADPVTMFPDACSPLASDLPTCALNHEAYCTGDDEQNSHQELLGTYGARAEDTTVPTIDSVSPADGAEVMGGAGVAVPIRVTPNDDSNALGVMVTLAGPAGTFDFCTNNVCDSGDLPTPVPGEELAIIDLTGAATVGEWTMTVEVQDIYGNMVSQESTFSIVGAGGDEGDESDEGDEGDEGDEDSGDEDSGGDEDEDDGNQDDDGDGGGGCRVAGFDGAPTGAALLMGLLALGRRRRRG